MNRSFRTAVAVSIAAASLALAGCAGDADANRTAGTEVPDDLGDIVDLTGKAEVSVDVVDNSYTPKAFKVSPGTKVTFRNTGANLHNVTPNQDGAFPAVTTSPGESAVVVAPQSPKTYRFYCTLHGGPSSGQRGALLVAPA